MKSKLVTLLILLALLFVPTSSARAQSPGGDVVLVGNNYTLKSGETLNGSIVVIGGNVNVEKDAKVTGDVVVIGGNLTLNGNSGGSVVIIGGNAASTAKVSGDMVAIGGQIDLKKTAFVSGNVVTMGGQLSREDGAKIEGDVVNNAPPVDVPATPNAPSAPVGVYVNPLWNIVGQFIKAIVIAGVAMLLALFLQPQMERVSDTIVKQPFISGSFGLLTVAVPPLAILIMVVTLILIPVAAIAAFIVLPAIWVFGMVALGQEIGERFTKAVNQVWSPVFTTGLGTFLLVFVLGALSSVPPVECIGGLVSVLVSLVVMGGVIKTWVESRGAAKPSAPVMVEVPPVS